eukprot:tig00001085_g6966.t1
MPVSLEYTWEETEAEVFVKVPLKPGLEKNLNIESTDVLLKLNCPPYLLLLDLHDIVDDAKSKAVVEGGTLHFTLVKSEPKRWGQLTAKGDRRALQERREASMKAKAERERKAREELQEKRAQEERWAFDRSWQLEKDERARIEELKESEKAAHERALGLAAKEAAAARAASQPEASALRAPGAPAPARRRRRRRGGRGGRRGGGGGAREEEEVPELEDVAGRRGGRGGRSSARPTSSRRPGPGVRPPRRGPRPAPGAQAALPGVRRGGTVTTSFTSIGAAPNVPARESVLEREAAERRQREAQARKAADAKDLSEENPAWLKDRGDAFFKGKDFRSAESAYTAALELAPGLLGALANRAACRLLLEQWRPCADDCSAAIAALAAPHAPAGELPPPAALDEAARRALAKLLARRGAALWSLGLADEAAGDYEAALVYGPGDAAVASDLAELRAAASGLPPTRPQEAEGGPGAGPGAGLARRVRGGGALRLKERGDAMLAERGDVEGAIEAYTAGLRLAPRLPALLANRAAAFLRAGRPNECVQDATLLLSVLRAAPAPAPGPSCGPSCAAARPTPSSSASARVRGATGRGGAGRGLSGGAGAACGDYEAALALEPGLEELAEDLARLRARLAPPTPPHPPRPRPTAPPDPPAPGP